MHWNISTLCTALDQWERINVGAGPIRMLDFSLTARPSLWFCRLRTTAPGNSRTEWQLSLEQSWGTSSGLTPWISHSGNWVRLEHRVQYYYFSPLRSALPSPNFLKNKILIKAKKIKLTANGSIDSGSCLEDFVETPSGSDQDPSKLHTYVPLSRFKRCLLTLCICTLCTVHKIHGNPDYSFGQFRERKMLVCVKF